MDYINNPLYPFSMDDKKCNYHDPSREIEFVKKIMNNDIFDTDIEKLLFEKRKTDTQRKYSAQCKELLKNNYSATAGTNVLDMIELKECIDSVGSGQLKQQEITSVLTSLINDVYISNPSCLYNFLQIIISIFTAAIDAYKKKNNYHPLSIQIIYKGGNLLKSIFTSEINLLLSKIKVQNGESKKIYDFLKSGFENSDCDFTISIYKYLFTYKTDLNKIDKDIQKISYLCLSVIRKVFVSNRENIFKIYGNREDEKREKIKKYEQLLLPVVKKYLINEGFTGNEVNDVFICSPNLLNKVRGTTMEHCKCEKKDMIINMDGLSLLPAPIITSKPSQNNCYEFKKLKNVVSDQSNLDFLKSIIKLNKLLLKNIFNGIDPKFDEILSDEYLNSDFPISWNTKIKLPHIKFSLVRMKGLFNIYFKLGMETKIIQGTGELIDISIVVDEHMYEQEKLLTRKIPVGPNYNFSITTYSNEYLIEDLQDILFISTSNMPWLNKKFLKRYVRLMGLLFFSMLRAQSHGAMIEYLRQTQNENIIYLTDSTDSKNLQIILKTLNYIKMSYNIAKSSSEFYVPEFVHTVESDTDFELVEIGESQVKTEMEKLFSVFIDSTDKFIYLAINAMNEVNERGVVIGRNIMIGGNKNIENIETSKTNETNEINETNENYKKYIKYKNKYKKYVRG